MSDEVFISYAQNGEDVVLWRGLRHVKDGVYIDVGGWDPEVDSVTRALYERGWRGIDIEPVPEFAEKFRQRRTRNEVVEAVVTDADVTEVVLHRFGGTGMSTIDDDHAARHEQAGFSLEDITVAARRLDDILTSSALPLGSIHLLKVDVEGAEEQVLRSIDLARWRPWVLVVEATEPNSTNSSHEGWEPSVLSAGYTFTLFDGLSRYYVSTDHPELVEAFSYPACALDDFVLSTVAELRSVVSTLDHEIRNTRAELLRWRNEAVAYWANAVAKAQASEEAATRAQNRVDRVSGKLDRTRATLEQARNDRKRLRARVRRMAGRIEHLESVAKTNPGVRHRLRHVVDRMRRT